MMTLTLSDTETYAIAIALSRYVGERTISDTQSVEMLQLADISNRLLEHADGVLTARDEREIEHAIKYDKGGFYVS